MTYLETREPTVRTCAVPAIETILEERPASVNGLAVGRLLPSVRRRMVGPFIFLDHMGPAELGAGQGIDVPPHPHINLATVTYLFEGEILHRDTLGSVQAIQPGAINWMTAGRGIAHSERTPPHLRMTSKRLHGIQLWVALPQKDEETEPAFAHYPAAALPELDVAGARVRLLAGTGFGAVSPVRTFSPLIYAEVAVPAGGVVPLPEEHRELAIFIIEGTLTCGIERLEPRRMLVCADGLTPELHADAPSRVMLLGGAPLDGKRHIWWNFVSSSRDRIEQAKRDWKERRFGLIPGDDVEFVPLP